MFGVSLVAEMDREFVVATTVRPSELRSRLTTFADALARELGATVGPSAVRVSAGPMVADAAGLARSLPAALEALHLSRRLGLGSRTVLASDLGVYHLLSNVADDVELERFVQEQLGPLLEQDARHGSDLVQTLDAYLEAGLGKTAAARALGIRRQTLYARLERISRLLGGLDIEAPPGAYGARPGPGQLADAGLRGHRPVTRLGAVRPRRGRAAPRTRPRTVPAACRG